MSPVGASLRWLFAGLLASVLGASLSCADETHDEQVQALGPEQPGVPRGPMHRPGQPCLTCHGGSGPASLQMSVGGTVYDTQGQTTPSVNATVQIEDVDGHIWNARTNAVGNFFVSLEDFAPHYPTQPNVAPSDGAIPQQMTTHISRDGSCADCHANPPGPNSAGPVYAHHAPSGG